MVFCSKNFNPLLLKSNFSSIYLELNLQRLEKQKKYQKLDWFAYHYLRNYYRIWIKKKKMNEILMMKNMYIFW